MEVKNLILNNTIDLVVDRISDLPDSILGHILSFLPTDNAVATSILSKRWKFAWVTVHSLDFDNFGEDKEEEEEIVEFVRFVDRVLLLNDSGSLNKFSLACCSLSISPQIISWINTAITRNVHELNLAVGDIDLPTTLFSCDSLRSLDLYGFISIYDTTAVCLPRLERLRIEHVSFESTEACEKLISGCPILHYLNLDIERYDGEAPDEFTCIISSAVLRHLDVYFEDPGKLKLKASSLEYLRLIGCVSEIFVEKSLNSLVQADFEIMLNEHGFPNNSIVEAVHAFDCAKILTLSVHVMRALRHATISLSTEFKRLVKLVAGTNCCYVQDFIQNSENLEDLIIHQNPIWPRDLHDHSRWTAPIEVPRCLSNSLKKVRLDGYKGLEDERKMIRYMLEYGSVLEVMQIYCYSMGDGERLELFQEIREFPRKSPACKVQFHVWSTKRESILIPSDMADIFKHFLYMLC